jgi:hypothetical protein
MDKQIGKKPVNYSRTFTNGSAKEFQGRKMFGRGKTQFKHGKETKANGTNGS